MTLRLTCSDILEFELWETRESKDTRHGTGDNCHIMILHWPHSEPVEIDELTHLYLIDIRPPFPLKMEVFQLHLCYSILFYVLIIHMACLSNLYSFL